MGGRRRGEKNSQNLPRIDWCTPELVLEVVREVYPEGIALDPCDHPSSVVGAVVSNYLEKYYAQASKLPGAIFNDGLALDWHRTVLEAGHTGPAFVNFPYSRGTTRAWFDKCYREAQKGLPVFVLGPACVCAKQFHPCWHADGITFPPRLEFIGADFTADFENALVYFGDRVEAFRKATKAWATVTKSGMHPPGEV